MEMEQNIASQNNNKNDDVNKKQNHFISKLDERLHIIENNRSLLQERNELILKKIMEMEQNISSQNNNIVYKNL
jgi:hypothetical protein